MTLEGALDGGEDNIKPNDEKQAAARNIPNKKDDGLDYIHPMAKPITIGNMGITIPNKKDASISPKIRVVMDIGRILIFPESVPELPRAQSPEKQQWQ